MEQKQFHAKETFRFKRFARKSYSAFCSLSKVVSIGVMAGCTLTIMSESAVAQNGKSPVRILEKELEEVMVTASLTETPLEEATKSVVVITKQEVQQAPIQSINDLLVYAASVDVIQRGGHGVQTDLSIRGGSLDQVAVLINGINLSNAQTGHHSLNIPINTSDIERIEILHGPSALVYGSAAFSGGINIITKKDVAEKLFASVEAGMHKFRSIQLRGAHQIGKTQNSLSVGYKASDGYIENSDYDMYTIMWQTRLQLEKQNKVDFQLGLSDKKFGANTFYSAKYPNQYEQTSSYVSTIKGEFGSKLKYTPVLYWTRNHDRFDLIRNTKQGQNYHRGDTYGINQILTYSSKLGHTSLSAEVRKDEIMSSKLGVMMKKPHRKYLKCDSRTNMSTGLEHTTKINRVILSAGFLLNNNSIERNKYYFLLSASASYSPTRQIKIHSSWSKSTRIPTFTDLYYTTETHTANEKLKPEQSESWELGVKYNNDFISLYTTGYLSWGKNIIDWVKEKPEDAAWSSWNHTKINTKGIELGAKIDLFYFLNSLGKQTYLKIDYSQMNQDLDSKGMTSLYSLNYLKSKLTAQINHKIFDNFSAGWYFRIQNRAGNYIKYENLEPIGKENYAPYSTLDLKLNYTIDNSNVFININNIYNTKYYDLGNIPQAGFWLMGGISYKI